MKESAQHILEAADSAHQGIELAISLLQESLGNVGKILTQGCEELGEASLGSTMRLGQKLKELRFLLDDLLKETHGLCVLLGHDLGFCEDEVRILTEDALLSKEHKKSLMRRILDDGQELPLGKGEYRDDEQPF